MRICFSLLFCFSLGCSAQTGRLSGYELRWAVFHPIAALKVKCIGKRVAPIYNAPDVKQQLDAYASGGQLDAFRHVFYMAAFAQKVKAKKLRKLGEAHEKANYKQFLLAKEEEGEIPDSLSSVMDLKNNELGIMIGSKNKWAPLDTLRQLVIAHIRNGNALIMKRNRRGNYLDCQNRELPGPVLREWNIPKCLVPSSLIYVD